MQENASRKPVSLSLVLGVSLLIIMITAAAYREAVRSLPGCPV